MIHKPAIQRILEQPGGEGFKNIFDAMIAEAEEEGRAVGQVAMPFVGPTDVFTPGEWVPEFWFVVRKVHDDDDLGGRLSKSEPIL